MSVSRSASAPQVGHLVLTHSVAAASGDNLVVYTLPTLADGVAVSVSAATAGANHETSTAIGLSYTGVEGLTVSLGKGDDSSTVGVDTFTVGQKVDVQGVTIGKGYAGTIKRYHFKSGRASHGNSRSHNVPGSISMAQDPGRVFPGKRMSGHLGDVTCTTQNLDVVRVDEVRGLLLIKGAIPGSKGGFVTVRPAIKAKGAN